MWHKNCRNTKKKESLKSLFSIEEKGRFLDTTSMISWDLYDTPNILYPKIKSEALELYQVFLS
jgi:hypothetical protein